MDAVTTTLLRQILRDRRDELIVAWNSAIAASLRGRLSDAEVQRQTDEIYDAVLRTTEGDDGADLSAGTGAAGELRAVLTDLSRQRARHGFSASETAISVFALKEAVLSVLDGGPDELRAFVQMSRFVDDMGLYTFEVYAKTRESLISEQAEQLLELATPVVKLWDGVVALPLVGTLDSARAQVVMERLLQTLVDTGSPYAIIDITGVPAVDTQVAQHLLKTVMAARLMGAECVISGIRPQIAQTIVALGIEFGDIVTKSSLADALMHAVRQTRASAAAQASRRG